MKLPTATPVQKSFKIRGKEYLFYVAEYQTLPQIIRDIGQTEVVALVNKALYLITKNRATARVHTGSPRVNKNVALSEEEALNPNLTDKRPYTIEGLAKKLKKELSESRQKQLLGYLQQLASTHGQSSS